jgi:hypothetical protein
MMISNCARERKYKHTAFWWENLEDEATWKNWTK